ncbi:5996_t:CDS:2 [Cetraspora pellucida]|uniref:5996_t:CDS:1 n=1 Tax=Cetraspora pellucida TaxID=1433469 RepID=A0ACA9LUC5_9GLOM|nr:5996_t:CDS:2 [Cetraspora pellucida]
MPCYADTIVKIKHVRQKESNNQTMSVWAIGTYPIGRDDNEIELTIYVPVNSAECDQETQAIFKREEYYSVGGKIIPSCYAGITRPKMTVTASTHLTIVDKASISNKCPLKVSLTGTPQEMPTEINNTDGVVEIVMADYVNGQERDYTFKIFFPHDNPKFNHLKTTIRPHDSVIFINGFLEIIDHNLYVYAKEISYVNVKKNNTHTDVPQMLLTLSNPTRSKLLHIHQNMSKNLEDLSKAKPSEQTTSNKPNNTRSNKHLRSENDDNFADNLLDNLSKNKFVKSTETEDTGDKLELINNSDDSDNPDEEKTEKLTKKVKKPRKTAICSRKKSKQHSTRIMRSSVQLPDLTTNLVNSDKE